jgi:hypothetical protein
VGISKRSCNRRLAFAVALIALLLCGCAGRRAGGLEEGTGGARRGSEKEPPLKSILLPGQNRTLPSQDPRHAPGDRTARIGLIEETEHRPSQPSVPVSEAGRGEVRYQVQVLATGDPQKARRQRDRLEDLLRVPVSIERELGLSKVRVGSEIDRAGADALQRRLAGMGYRDAFVVESRSR